MRSWGFFLLALPLLTLLLSGASPFPIDGLPSRHSTPVPAAGTNSTTSSSQVTCPVGTDLSWGSVTLNCFQTIDVAEIAAILIGVAISLYVYWDYEKAELPGDSASIPVTVAEEIEQRKAVEERNG